MSRGGAGLAAIDIGWLDLRVVQVLDVQFHPCDPYSYVTYIDIGERFTRLCVCRLAEHYSPRDLKHGRRVGTGERFVALCNINHVNRAGVTSTARLLAAAAAGRRELLRPPSRDARPGDRVAVDGFARRLYDPIDAMHAFGRPVKPPKRKIFSAVSADLRVDGRRVATYRGAPLLLEEGPCRGGAVRTRRMRDCRIR